MLQKKIILQDICSENFNTMEPKGTGKHCKSCNSLVFDFRKLSDEELITTLKSGKYHCGQFTGDQLEKTYAVDEIARHRNKYWNSIAAALVAGILQITTGYSQTTNIMHPRLYNRSIAIAKGDQTSSGENVVTKTETTQQIQLNVQNADSKTGLSSVNIEVQDLNIQSETNTSGILSINIDKNIDPNKFVTIEISRYGYEPKTIRLRPANWINKTKMVFLKPKKYVRHDSYGGVYSF